MTDASSVDVAVIGAGPVGLSVGLAARHRGCTDVVVADRSERRLATAEELGLTPHQVADELDLAAFLRARHGTVETNPLLGPLPATDVFVEATGAAPEFVRSELERARRKNAEELLRPLVDALGSWRSEGWRVGIACDSATRSERLVALLAEYGVSAQTSTGSPGDAHLALSLQP